MPGLGPGMADWRRAVALLPIQLQEAKPLDRTHIWKIAILNQIPFSPVLGIRF